MDAYAAGIPDELAVFARGVGAFVERMANVSRESGVAFPVDEANFTRPLGAQAVSASSSSSSSNRDRDTASAAIFSLPGAATADQGQLSVTKEAHDRQAVLQEIAKATAEIGVLEAKAEALRASIGEGTHL